MKVVISTVEHEIFVVGVSGDMELENFLALCESESGVPIDEIVISFKGQPLMDMKMSLKDHGIRDHDVVTLRRYYRMDYGRFLHDPFESSKNPFKNNNLVRAPAQY